MLHLLTGSHTVAVVKGEESYDLLKSSFPVLFDTINKIIKVGKVTVDGCDIQVEIFLGGDYKVDENFCCYQQGHPHQDSQTVDFTFYYLYNIYSWILYGVRSAKC